MINRRPQSDFDIYQHLATSTADRETAAAEQHMSKLGAIRRSWGFRASWGVMVVSRRVSVRRHCHVARSAD